jgi:archaellum component FlaF (FlaF/FlaG flagellin family)
MINRIKKGVSPVIATTIIIGVTLVVGFATWGFASGAIGSLLQSQGETVASDINNLRERFVIVNVNISASRDKVTVWVYNNGRLPTEITDLFIGGSSTSMIEVPNSNYTSIGKPAPPYDLEVGQLITITFRHYSISGSDLYIKAIGKFGNSYTYSLGVP